MNCSNSIAAPASIALGKWLKQARQDAGLNMRDLAAKLDCAHSFIGKYENAQRRLDVIEFVRVCGALGADPAAGLALVLQTEKADKTVTTKWRIESGKLYQWNVSKIDFVFAAEVPQHLANAGLVRIVDWYQARRDQN